MSDSTITKEALAIALKDMMDKKPFNKIRISDIVALCKLERQTFYYHFEDKYALVIWMYQRDMEKFYPAHQKITYKNVLDLCTYFNHEKNYYQNIFMNGEKRIFHDLFYQTFYVRCYDELAHMQGIKDIEYCDFVSAYLATGTTGILVQWLVNENQMNVEHFAQNLYRVHTNIIANISCI